MFTSKINYFRFNAFILALVLFITCTPSGSFIDTEPSFTVAPHEEIDQTFTYAGKPEPLYYPNPLRVLYNIGYISAYDEVRGNPAWVAYRVFAIDEYIIFDRPSRFLIDDRTENRISHDVYTNSGYDRGHLAPNFAIVTRFGQQAQRESFLMTNIIPQRPSLNRHWWAQLERLIARNYSETYDQVWVLLGPVYKETGNWINERVKIPTHNFMIVKVEKDDRLKMIAFLAHQDMQSSEPLEPYLTSVRYIEEKTGLNFNPLFEEDFADSIESLIPESLW